MPVIKDDKTLMIRCTCHGHVLEISYEDWSDEDSELMWEPQFDVSIWNQTPYPYSFSNRMKLIWRLLRGKNLSADDVIIEKSDALAIVNFLEKQLNKNKT